MDDMGKGGCREQKVTIAFVLGMEMGVTEDIKSYPDRFLKKRGVRSYV